MNPLEDIDNPIDNVYHRKEYIDGSAEEDKAIKMERDRKYSKMFRNIQCKSALHRHYMFKFLKGMLMKDEEKEAVKPKKKSLPKKKKVAENILSKSDAPRVIGAATPMDANICLGKEDKVFLTIKPNGKMVFNKNDFPEWKADNFAREFVNIVEEITGYPKK
jgi:hypothetical protein